MKKISWTPEMDAVLGTDWDAVIAGKLNLSQQQVVSRRLKIGIPGYEVKSRDWKPEEEAVLGTGSLNNIAKILGRPTSQIQKRMKELKIPNYGQRGASRTTASIEAELEQKERNKVAFVRRMRIGAAVATSVANDNNLTEIAQKLGMNIGSVRWYFFKFLHVARHSSMLGDAICLDWKKIPPQVLKEAVRCIENHCDSIGNSYE